jgi:hypothetical protein
MALMLAGARQLTRAVTSARPAVAIATRGMATDLFDSREKGEEKVFIAKQVSVPLTVVLAPRTQSASALCLRVKRPCAQLQ